MMVVVVAVVVVGQLVIKNDNLIYVINRRGSGDLSNQQSTKFFRLTVGQDTTR
jgi:hypothetical protein